MKNTKLGRRLIHVLVTLILLAVFLGACGEPAPTTTLTTSEAPLTTTPAAAPSTTTPVVVPSTTSPATTTPKYGGTLRWIKNEEPAGSIGVPENFRGQSGSMVKVMLLEPLLYNCTDGTIKPMLAESYEWSDDYLSITLHLRKGVKFHDGTDFNAEAAKWNLDKRIAHFAAGTSNIKSIEIIDDYTIRIDIKEYINTWLTEHLCSTGQSHTSLMISPTSYETNGEEYTNWHPVGTGPYKFVSYKEGDSMKIERFDDYWGEKPYLDAVEWRFIADAVTAQIAFEAGEGDIIELTGHDSDLAREYLNQDTSYWAVEQPGLCITLIPSGARSASPFSNLKVRQAIEYAIYKEKIVEGVYSGYAYVLNQPCGVHQPVYDPDFIGYEYDREKARQLLSEGYYPKGFKTKLYCQVGLMGKQMEAVQAYLAAIGIDADIEVISVGKWIEMETYGWEDGLLLTALGPATWGGGHLERNWVQPTEPNWSRGLWWETLYRPPELEVLAQEYLHIKDDPQAEIAKGQEIVKLLHDEAICIPLWQIMGVSICQPYLKCTDDTQIYYTGDIRGRPINTFWLDK